MKTYHIYFKLKGQTEYLAFIARSLDNAIAYLRYIYEGMKIIILYVVYDGIKTEVL